MRKLDGLRILHFLNTARYDRAGTFLHEFDSNYKVMMKTVRFLPNCHHYIVVPQKNTLEKKVGAKTLTHTLGKNVTLLHYPYTHGSASNKASSDVIGFEKSLDQNAYDLKYFEKEDGSFEIIGGTNSAHFDGIATKKIIKLHDFDIDFIFNHMPENHYNILSVMGSKKYGFIVNSFVFYHWVDTPKSRLNYQIYETYFRQLEGLHLADKAFFHTTESTKYLELNFAPKQGKIPIKMDMDIVKEKEAYMPLASDPFPDAEPFELPVFKNKKDEEKEIIVFNHRWNTTTGVDRMKSYFEGLEEEFEIWSTDTKVSPPEYVKSGRLSSGQYRYLIETSLCSICFVDNYATWNLSLQDGLRLQKPVLIYRHPTFEAMLGKNYPFFFSNKEEFQKLLKVIKASKGKSFNYKVPDFETEFKTNIHTAMDDCLQNPKYKKESINLAEWLYIIYKKGYKCKQEILFAGSKYLGLHPESASWQFVRRQLLDSGVQDDCTEKITTYTIPKDKEKDIEKIMQSIKPERLKELEEMPNRIAVLRLMKKKPQNGLWKQFSKKNQE